MEDKSTIAGGVVINEYDEVIVVNQRGGSWSLPKGHIEKNETELEAAIREIYEESGVKNLELIKTLGSYERYGLYDQSSLKTRTIFLFKTVKQNLNPVDPDNPEALWIHKNKASEMLTHPKDKEFFLKILKEI
ncbi:MAG: NUDIX domain-containing protein [Minisyncoccales bacterium]